MKKAIMFLYAFTQCIYGYSQNASWEKNFGGNGIQYAYSVIQTSDGGYIATGYTDTYGSGGNDVYVVKVNTYGRMQWQQVIGGSGDDKGMGIVQNSSGEYYICGQTNSSGAGNYDVYVIKLNGGGNLIWTNTYGGTQADYGKSLVMTAAGDVVITGTTSSSGAGGSDFYLLKINSSGVLQWSKTFGTTGTEDAFAMQLVHDGGFVLSGKTSGYSINRGYAVRTNPNGDSIWTKAFDIGTLGGASLNGVCELTNQTNFVFAGYGKSFSYGNLVHVKTDLNGNVVYTNYTSVLADGGAGVTATSDGGYATVGYYSNFGSRVNVIKFSASGSQEWTRYYQYTNSNSYPYSSDGFSIRQTSDNGYVVGGMTNMLGTSDVLIMKLSQIGDGQLYSHIDATANGPTSFCVGGGTVTFSVPSGFTSYQWLRNGSAIAGATTSSFTPTATDGVICAMTDNDGIYFSTYISVVMTPIPTASISPTGSLNVNCGAAFPVLTSTTTTGTTRQWYLNGTAITGATAATYTPSVAGTYTVTATNSCGSSTSAGTTINLTSQLPLTPVISGFCSGLENICGYICGTCTLNTFTNPVGSVTYEWYYNGNLLSGYTTGSYVASAVGVYKVKAINSCGSATSINDTIGTYWYWCDPIYANPSTQGCGTTSVQLEAPWQALGPFQWYLNSSPIPGATNYNYTATASGSYQVGYRFSCSPNYFYNDIISQPYNVTINLNPLPNISAAGNTSVCTGSVTLTASPAGSTYQWKLNNNNISGATLQSYSASATGNYTCTITSAACGIVNSNSITVNVGNPTGSISPVAPAICSGNTSTLSVSSPFSGLTYQWRLNSSPVSGATSSSYGATQAGVYDCILTNSCGSFTTNTSTLTLNPSPTATINPSGIVNVCTGGNVTLNASTGGGYTYQWKLNGGNISGATGSSYVASSAGSYTVVVTAGGCTSTSSVVTVTIVTYPVASIWSSTPLQFCSPGAVALNANGGTGFSYQWFLNGNVISGATQRINSVSASGSYTTTVTNSSGCSTTSAPVVVSSNVNPFITITTSRTLPFCVGDSVELYSSITGTNYLWSRDQVVIPAATSFSYYANTVGLYSLSVTDLSGCIGKASIGVTTKTGPTATISSGGITVICNGGNVLLSATSAADYLFQWYLNGSAVSGATASTYSATTTGGYYCIVTNECGSATSTTITLTTGSPPNAAITAGGSTNICSGNSVILTANTAGVTSFQWKLNGSNISGATVSQYSANASGSYTCTETNTCGTSTSNAITVTVSPQPTVSISAGGPTTFCTGSSVNLNATSATAISYQWKLNGSAISGATATAYVATTDGQYTCTVTNSCGSATSGYIFVTVQTGVPVATISSNSTTLCSGSNISINANFGSGISYQWRLNGATISGATGQSYSATAAGTYDCIETNTCGSATSNSITLTMISSPTASITANGPTAICSGGFSVQLQANSGAGYFYQWYRNGLAISGAISINYSTNVAASYICIVSNQCGSSTSNIIQITYNGVYPAATITAFGPTTFCTGSSVLLIVNQDTATTYQWSKSGVDITGATNYTYTATLTGTYSCMKSNSCGTSSSNVISVTVQSPLTPVATYNFNGICPGGYQQVFVSPINFTNQWRFNGTNISGATQYFYNAYNTGDYDCIVSNACGSFTSNTVTFTTASPPTAVITGGGTICGGSTVTLSANTGTGLYYQWRLNGTNISGATTSTYGATATGNYDCVVSNYCGNTPSNVITINAGAAPSTPGSITGQASGVCSSTKTYSISAVAGATGYTWSVPGGATLVSGQGTVSISVSFNGAFSSGSISVIATNGCGNSGSSATTVAGVPAQPGSISGPASVCHNQNNVNYSIVPVAGATSYTWTVPPGTLIKNGQGTTQIKVRFGNVGGNITVQPSNACGSGTVRTLAIAMPCRESVDDEEALVVSVFPNPTTDRFIMDVQADETSFYSLVVTDLSGRIVEKYDRLPVGLRFEFGGNLSTGFYFAEIIAAEERTILRIVKDN